MIVPIELRDIFKIWRAEKKKYSKKMHCASRTWLDFLGGLLHTGSRDHNVCGKTIDTNNRNVFDSRLDIAATHVTWLIEELILFAVRLFVKRFALVYTSVWRNLRPRIATIPIRFLEMYRTLCFASNRENLLVSQLPSSPRWTRLVSQGSAMREACIVATKRSERHRHTYNVYTNITYICIHIIIYI